MKRAPRGQAHFLGPDIAGPAGQYPQGHGTVGQAVDDLVDGAVAADDEHSVQALLHCLVGKLGGLAGTLGLVQSRPPAVGFQVFEDGGHFAVHVPRP